LRRREGAALLGALGLVVLVLASTGAKRPAPRDVAPLVADGVRYEVPHLGNLHGKSQNGGYVRARDAKTGDVLWDRMVYRVSYDPDAKKDFQDVFIKEIEIRGTALRVTTERGEELEMDLRSGRVRAVTPLGPRLALGATP
jgi:hypothetical protein